MQSTRVFACGGPRRGIPPGVVRTVQTLVTALALSAALPSVASAYEEQVSLDLGVGWGFAPALDMFPNHGPLAGLGATIGFDDTWGLAFNAAWAVHPPFVDATDAPFHVGQFGVEALYYVDILQIVPFFGVGVDLLPISDGTSWTVDFAAHLRISIDYLLSRDLTIGVDVRPYILLTALNVDPIYISTQLRMSFLFDY